MTSTLAAPERPHDRLLTPHPLRRFLAVLGKYASLIVFSMLLLLPLVVIVFASFKTAQEYATTSPIAPPQNWLNFENFATAWVGGDMLRGFVNTGLVLTLSIVVTILIGTMAAYALDRFEFRAKKLVFALFLIATLVPGVTTQVATYQVINGFGLVNTYWAAVLLFSGTDIVSIYIFVQFMQSIPKSLDEAAMLEGTSRFGIYWRIILPLLQPAIVTVIIIKGIAIYNEFYIPLLYMPTPELNMVSTSLFRFIGPFSSSQQIIAAGVIIVIIPTLVIFLSLQRFIYNGITRGATK
ncbi:MULTISPECIES: carbohydrate ABC transporter permease [unclassified Rathayibacter]|uniref:carbohydrate ABC transporter permease n=1 Tax=unclassified Rathayibacter TaxID=2609250 RepID=UPI000F4CE4C7|nr:MULTISPECIES: carbohydrate ABC transporter permease [unclassified Rathayibacter]ROP49155.1 multiple sugar transport system permease protein [Rathayibacter sp. PhB186]ROS50728.1 multiple sugar transport system permease protein [Rathayibacter sp. PhB185]